MALPARLVAMLAGALTLALVLAAASASRAAQSADAAGAPRGPAPAQPAAAFGSESGAADAGSAPAASPATTASLLAAAAGTAVAPAGQGNGAANSPEARELRAPLIAKVPRRGSVLVRRWPNGPVRARLAAKTEFGSRRALAVAAVRGDWLGVATTARPDGRLGWVHRRRGGIRLTAAPLTLVAYLSRRQVELRRGDRVLRRLTVAVGRPGSSTPTGVYAVTDKLDGRRLSSYYGCCILALSGTQPNLPAGWRGGNRLAIHGTSSPGTIGEAASAGCLRGSDRDLRALMRLVPLGTTVTIRP